MKIKNLFIIFILILLILDNIYYEKDIYKIRAAEVLSIFVSIFILFIFASNKYHIPLFPSFWLFILFFLINIFSLYLNNRPPFTKGIILIIHFIGYFTIAFLYVLFISLISDINSVDRIINRISILICILGISQFLGYYLFNFLLYINESIPFLGGFIKITIFSYPPNYKFAEFSPWLRPNALFREPVYLGLFCCWIFGVSIFKLFIKDQYMTLGNRKRTIIVLILSGITIIMTASRAAILGMILSTITGYLLAKKYLISKKYNVFNLMISILIFAIIVILALSSMFSDRIRLSFLYEDARLIIYSAQLDDFARHPLLGLGPGSTEDTVRRVLPPSWEPGNIPTGGYSTIFTILNDSGLIGLVIYIFIFIRIYNARKRLIDKRYFIGYLGYLNGILAIFAASIFFPIILGFPIFWLGIIFVWLFYLRGKPQEILQRIR